MAAPLRFSTDINRQVPDRGRSLWGRKMQKDGPNDPVIEKTGRQLPVERTTFKWPWGVVALTVLALGWVGAYLLWNGIVFLFGL